MTSTLTKACLKASLAFALFFAFIPVFQVAAFSLTNCTVSGALNDSQALKVLCYKMGFCTVPSPIPRKVRYLDISFNFISNVRVGDFQDLWNLRNLNLSNSNVSWIQEGTAKHFPNLLELNLADNMLKSVSGGLLDGLVKLQVLRLDGNRIERIDAYAFEGLQNVKVLNLSGNLLRRVANVKPALSALGLEELFIGNNGFDVFNSYDLSRTALSLKKIVVSHNPFTKFEIADDIFPNLTFLDVSHCGQNKQMIWNITDKSFLNSVTALNLTAVRIPEESVATVFHNAAWASLVKLRISELKRIKTETLTQYACSPGLEVLRLQRNKISKLTARMLAPCSNVTELDFGDNEISQISSLDGLTRLRVLRLQINKLAAVNNSLRDLPTLEFLDLSRNRISALTCLDFAGLTRLTSLYLYGNKISRLPKCAFENLSGLENLRLGSNKILTLGVAFENRLPSLKDLQLMYNKLSTIYRRSFEGLSSLRSLDLGDNQIFKIEAYAFSGLQNLTELKLSSNRISEKTLQDPAVFSGMPNLKSLELYSNVISFAEDTLQAPPFVNVSSLECLTIHSQRRGLGKMPSNLLQGLTSLKMFYGGSMNLNSLHPATFASTPELWFLELSKNAFADDGSITARLFHPIPKLSKLIISRSQIHSLNFLIGANLTRLSVLKASENTLDVVNQTLIRSLPRLKFLDVRKNTFACDCTNFFFINWALQSNATQVVYLGAYACGYPPSLRGKSVLDLDTESCNVDLDFVMFLCSVVAVALTLLLAFVYQFLRWQVLYAYYLFAAFLYDSKRKQRGAFNYDAFVSYNARDEPWVVRELLPNLEGEQGWRLCLHHRDFEPGRSIVDNIVDGIYSSRKTICLITYDYLKSTWCSKEIQMANFRLFDEQKDVLILVFLEDIPTHQLSPYYRIRKLVKKKTYLKWPKRGGDTRLFWQKLRMALETRDGPEEEKALLSGQRGYDF